MAHFLTVVPILIIGMFTGGMFVVILRFFSPSLNKHPNQRLRNFMLWTLGVGPLLLCIGFSLKLLFQLSTFFWLVIPVLILFIGGFVIFYKTPVKRERQTDRDRRESGKLIQKHPQPKETREEEQEQGPMRM